MMGKLTEYNINSLEYKLTNIYSTLKEIDLLVYKYNEQFEQDPYKAIQPDKIINYLKEARKEINKTIKYLENDKEE